MSGPACASIEMLRRLVGFDTTRRGSNLALIDLVCGWLEDHGVESQPVFDETERKAIEFAELSGYLGFALEQILACETLIGRLFGRTAA